MSATNRNFRIHGTCLIKNELDIIAHTLEKARQWCDFIYIFDNGSTDGTWELIQELQDEQIIPWERKETPFRDHLRNQPFNAFRDNSQPGDWWCRLDSDEYYVQNPKEFLASVPAPYHVVKGVAIEYYLTREDVDEIDFNQDMSKIIDCLRYYRAENSEPRFFRDRRGLQWEGEQSWPLHAGPVYPEKIYYRHYKYRTPEQIQRRLQTRHQAIKDGYVDFGHAVEDKWEDKLQSRAELNYDAHDGKFSIDWDKVSREDPRFPRSTIQYMMHRLGIWP